MVTLLKFVFVCRLSEWEEFFAHTRGFLGVVRKSCQVRGVVDGQGFTSEI
jgi:hypothetical protein